MFGLKLNSGLDLNFGQGLQDGSAKMSQKWPKIT